MAATPEWKVFNARKEYKAACKDVEDAAILAELYGRGATIRNRTWSSKPLYTVGSETVGPDMIAHAIARRCDEIRAENIKRNPALAEVYAQLST